jgi:transcriptional regulator with XRE-family HTH domain
MEERLAYATVVGQVVQRLRGRVSQETLAQKAGLSQSALSRFENGQSLPDAYELRRLASALGKTTSELSTLVEQAFTRTKDVAKKVSSDDTWSGIAAVAMVGFAMVGVVAVLEEQERKAKRRGR